MFYWLREWFAEDELRRFVHRLVADPDTAEQVFTLVEGATVVAAMTGDADAALRGRAAAQILLSARTDTRTDARSAAGR